MKKRNSKNVCQLCMDFCNKYENYSDMQLFIDEYKILMKKILKYNFKIPARCADEIICSLGQGNWEHLWETEEEQTIMTPIKIKEYVLEEIFYCSDRWSWDRILRVNWAMIRLQRKINQ